MAAVRRDKSTVQPLFCSALGGLFGDEYTLSSRSDCISDALYHDLNLMHVIERLMIVSSAGGYDDKTKL